MSIGTVLLIILIAALLGGSSGFVDSAVARFTVLATMVTAPLASGLLFC